MTPKPRLLYPGHAFVYKYSSDGGEEQCPIFMVPLAEVGDLPVVVCSACYQDATIIDVDNAGWCSVHRKRARLKPRW